MTLVFDRTPANTPATHAFIVGCGHFPHLPGAPAHDRLSCPDSARAMVDFLVSNRDRLQAPLASIRCAITEADGKPGCVPTTDTDHDPRSNTAVANANRVSVADAGDAWMAQCRPGDHLFFYACAHGIAERDGSVFVLLEDIHKSANRKWENALDVRALARELPAAVNAGACWVFLDACQELLPDISNQITGIKGWKLINATLDQMVSSKSPSVALAAARFGGYAEAPKAGGVAYFTQALIDGLGESCVERTPSGWMVSGKEVIFGISRIAEIGYGQLAVETEPLSLFNDELYFCSVSKPAIPILVTSLPSSLLNNPSNAEVVLKSDGSVLPTLAASPQWRFRAPVNNDYRVTVGLPPDHISADFFTKPPAVAVEIVLPTPANPAVPPGGSQ